MAASEGLRAAALNRFLQEYLEDREAGAVRRLEEYRARYPQIAEAIEGEVAQLEAGATLDSEPEAESRRAAGRRIGPYVLERELGSGGQGSVFLARACPRALTEPPPSPRPSSLSASRAAIDGTERFGANKLRATRSSTSGVPPAKASDAPRFGGAR